jgi:hypothetical protein
MAGKRTSILGEWRGLFTLAETAMLAPLVASRRLRGLPALSLLDAATAWNGWGWEKAVAFQQCAWRAAFAALSTKPWTLATSARVAQPVRRRVKRKARRRRHN